jgi:hypothetical protein
MTSLAPAHSGPVSSGRAAGTADETAAWLPPPARRPAGGSAPAPATTAARTGTTADPARARAVRSWPLLILALPAAVTIWSGWVGIGTMTGFGTVHPLPGIWNSLRLNTAVTLPVGVEAYAAYALRAWLTTSPAITARTRRYARRSATASLLLGMAGQVAYHLLTQAGVKHAPWPVTTAVSCLPVLVLGMGAALAHLLHADACTAGTHVPAADSFPGPARPVADKAPRPADTTGRDRLAHAEAVARRLADTGQRVSRRTLRAAGIRGSNASLGTLARALAARLDAT